MDFQGFRWEPLLVLQTIIVKLHHTIVNIRKVVKSSVFHCNIWISLIVWTYVLKRIRLKKLICFLSDNLYEEVKYHFYCECKKQLCLIAQKSFIGYSRMYKLLWTGISISLNKIKAMASPLKLFKNELFVIFFLGVSRSSIVQCRGYSVRFFIIDGHRPYQLL